MRRKTLAMSLVLAVTPACGTRTGLDLPIGQQASPPGSNVPTAPACAAPAPVPVLLFQDPGVVISGLAIDADAVYFTAANQPEVTRVSKCDGTSRVIAPPPHVSGPALDLVIAGGNLAWIVLDGAGGWVVTAPTAGGAARVITHVPANRLIGDALAMDEGRAYFVKGVISGKGAMESVSLGGGTLTSLTPGWVGPFAVDSTRVYAAQSPPTGQALLSVPKHGGSPQVLVPFVNAFDHDRFAVDDAFVYWLEWNDQGHGSAVMRVPKGGGNVATLVKDQSSPSSIAVDDHDLYWAIADDGVHRTLMRAPKAGGAAQVVTAGALDALALDQRTLYWSAGDALMKLDK